MDVEVAHTTLAEALFDIVPIPALVHDQTTLLAANGEACSMLGAQSAADLVGRSITDIVHPDGHDAGAVRRELLLKHGHRFSNTTVKLLTLTGEPLSVTGTGVTCTIGDRPHAVLAACKNTTCLSIASGVVAPPPTYCAETPAADAALDSLPLPVIAVADRSVAYVNRAAIAALQAREASDIVGRPLFDFVHPEAIANIAQQLLLTLAHGVRLTDTPVKARALDGSMINARGNGARTRFDGRDYALFVATSMLD